MAKNTGMDFAQKAARHGAKINNFGEQWVQIHTPDRRVSVICPKGEMRASMEGFIWKVLKALALLSLPFLFLLGILARL